MSYFRAMSFGDDFTTEVKVSSWLGMITVGSGGMTMICVTHEMGFARTVAHQMVFMDEGRIIERSPPAQFFSEPEHERTQLFLSQILSH